MTTTPLAVLGLGFVLGIRHSLDVDHLAAVSAIVSRRRGLLNAAAVGALWGIGHTASLLAVGVAVIGFRTAIPPAVGSMLELGVAAMLVALGLNLLRTVRHGGSIHLHPHGHGGHLHVHPHVHAPWHAADVASHHPVRATRRPLYVGVMHGLAGSAGLMLAVLATIPHRGLALAYVFVFGCGSIGGMVVMSALLGAPMTLLSRRFARAESALQGLAAVGSVAIGLLLAWRIGVETGMLTL